MDELESFFFSAPHHKFRIVLLLFQVLQSLLFEVVVGAGAASADTASRVSCIASSKLRRIGEALSTRPQATPVLLRDYVLF